MILCVLAVPVVSFGAAIYVEQPSYHSMNFYVYKPANVPGDFYVTYDGYLVYRDINGVWKYGVSNGNAYTKTDFVVGSVIPSVAGITLWDRQGRVVPNAVSNGYVVHNSVPAIVYTHPSSVPVVTAPVTVPAPVVTTPVVTHAPVVVPAPAPVTQAVVIPQTQWSLNANFMAISRWRNSVDRIGVLDRPAMPVAWKGENPRVVYAWNGLTWKQLNAGSIRRPLNIIRRDIYDLTVEANRINLLNWTSNDSFVLAQYAAIWGYRWLGLITVR